MYSMLAYSESFSSGIEFQLSNYNWRQLDFLHTQGKDKQQNSEYLNIWKGVIINALKWRAVKKKTLNLHFFKYSKWFFAFVWNSDANNVDQLMYQSLINVAGVGFMKLWWISRAFWWTVTERHISTHLNIFANIYFFSSINNTFIHSIYQNVSI